MKSRIWRLTGVGLLCVSVSAQSLADEPQYRGPDSGERGADHQGKGQGHDGNNQPRQQSNEIIRGDNSRKFELHDQNQGGERQNRPSHDPNTQGGQWQNRVQHDANVQERAPQQPSNNLPIQGRPDTVRQTQEPRRGYYQDEPRRNNDNRNWQTGGSGSRHDDRRWPGRPDGHGNGWGPGPQYRPGYVIDRFPERNYRVPYRGQDFFYSGGYWYRPQGPRYVVVQPPRGIRVRYLPDYAREVWIGGALLFLENSVADDQRVRRWQRWWEPIHHRVFQGLFLTRDIPSLILDAGLRIEQVNAVYLSRFPKSWSHCCWGTALKDAE